MDKKLFRMRKSRVFGGVAAGLGKYLDVDPIIVRIILILITIFNGIGILIYIILWIVIPEEPIENFYESFAETKPNDFSKTENAFDEDSPAPKINSTSSSSGRVIIGSAFIGLGIIFLLDKFLPIFNFDIIFPIGLIMLGIGIIYNFFNKTEKKI